MTNRHESATNMPCASQDSMLLLAFNISQADCAMLAKLFHKDQSTDTALFFADRTGFMQLSTNPHYLQSKVAQLEENLLATTKIREGSYNASLRWFFAIVQRVDIDRACWRLNICSPSRAKEIAIAACLRDSDWIVQAVPDWPNNDYSTDNSHIYLNSIVEYVSVTLLGVSSRGLTTDVRSLFRIIEATNGYGPYTAAVVRIAPEYETEQWVMDAIFMAMSAESHRPHGFRANGVCHLVRPSTWEVVHSILLQQNEDISITTGGSLPRKELKTPQSTQALSSNFHGNSTHKSFKSTASDMNLAANNAELLREIEEGTSAPTHHSKVSQSRQGSRSPTTYNGRGPFDTSPRPNGIDIERIYSGLDVRTTIMLRNLPNRLTHEDLYDYLLSACPGEFDFLYVRIDFSNGCNVGYGFVNLVSPQSVIGFVEKFRGFHWPGSEKVAEVSYATQQGREALISRFRNSSVMTKGEASRPKLYYSIGHPLAGMEEPFPEPDNLAKLQRSQQNADTEGLYETRGRRNGMSLLRHRHGPLDPQKTHHHLDDESPMADSHAHRSWLKSSIGSPANFQPSGSWNWICNKHH